MGSFQLTPSASVMGVPCKSTRSADAHKHQRAMHINIRGERGWGGFLPRTCVLERRWVADTAVICALPTAPYSKTFFFGSPVSLTTRRSALELLPDAYAAALIAR